MTLSPPVNRAQKFSNSSPNAAALRAATLSFGKKLPPSPRQAPNTRNSTSRPSSPARRRNAGDDSLPLAAQQNLSKEQVYSRSPASAQKSPLHSRPSSMVTANLVTVRSGGGSPRKGGEEEESLPVRGTVDARRKLFYGGDAQQDDLPPLPITSTRLPKISPTHSGSPEFQGVDGTSLDDISSLKVLFEKSISRQPSTRSTPPAIHAPKPTWPVASPNNPSLTAAILATQLPSNPAQISRRDSPILKPISASTHRIPTQRNPQNHLDSSNALPELRLPLPHDGLRVSRIGVSPSPSRESMSSKISATSDHNNALLAATLASKPKASSSPQTQPPKPPPPRRAQTGLNAAIVAPNGRVSDFEDDSGGSSTNLNTTKYLKYDTARSSNSSSSSAPPPPRRRRSIGQLSRQSTGDRSSVALTAAVLSVASSRDMSPLPPHSSHNTQQALLLPRHLTGDSARAASLAPSRVASPAPKKPPAPPVPRRGRRKSLPPPSKTGLRETMRKPPKAITKDISPQKRKPHLVKHHPHKHSEGERRRWRHFITESERRRYEGLWAANKGVLLTDANTPPSSVPPRAKSHGPHNFQQQQHVWSSTPNYTEPLADCIDSLIARDIWARSRLSFDHLADVWDLVDREEKGRLSRDEFVVGTWLVDQSLKGRKLPSKVQDEVWQSVRRLGVQIQPVNKA
ncbi:Increased rDNA silencing protein [Maublancomyces gigas]|uniref:Increased rDNA silencing protein n=1 Tax=Discina gigas TaxID=1032678 RepID=A0ABR3GUG8_9PEZI